MRLDLTLEIRNIKCEIVQWIDFQDIFDSFLLLWEHIVNSFKFMNICYIILWLKRISDRLWQKQAGGQKISFVHCSLELIYNNFWLKCLKNYYSIFMGSRDMHSIVVFYLEIGLQFWEKLIQSLLTQIEILSSACVFNLKFLGTTKAKRQNEVIF